MIQTPKSISKPWEVVIQNDGVELPDKRRFLDGVRAARYAHYHNRMRELGFRAGRAEARLAPHN